MILRSVQTCISEEELRYWTYYFSYSEWWNEAKSKL